ncbi:ATP-binding cassette domain-containing protein [Clostridiaceae bacterium DONG20-135]|uniref:ATP-binding cassette domain-containing protein n=1 Tax=Copranaerobaculum intestinale TaxID=2692629 RepID=A0A6N8U3P4_9FIRM|nr:ABC transporter ATP-binding protein [Copranaerobaculum intestinale]MXQ72816.1 ATP-binding cassette domain-containing protein [Copranaerobaculum intestinale]
MITLKHVSKVYQPSRDVKVTALSDINLQIDENEDIAIIGKSGSGKSTLMNLITCIDTISEGEYILKGIDVRSRSRTQLAVLRNQHFGFIYQNFNLLNHLNAYENIELPLIYAQIKKNERDMKVKTIAEKVGILDRLDHRPSELSGGEKQRVAIARALINDPEIIIADEPTGALDEQTGKQIIAILKGLHEQGKTVIMVTHDMDIAALSKRRITLADGRIIGDEQGVQA